MDRNGDLGGALEAAGHDAGAPRSTSAKGLLPYLTLEASAVMLRTLRERTPGSGGSAFVATFLVAPEPHDVLLAVHHARDVWFRALGEARRQEFQPGDPEKLFVVTGWRAVRSMNRRASRINREQEMVVLAGEPGHSRTALSVRCSASTGRRRRAGGRPAGATGARTTRGPRRR